MTTTSVAPTSTERTALNRQGAAKPNGQQGSAAGQFAALMLQADEDAPKAEALGLDTPTPETSDTGEAKKETGAEAAQLALQALLDWRSLTTAQPAEPSVKGSVATGSTADTQRGTPLRSDGPSTMPSGQTSNALAQLPQSASSTPKTVEAAAVALTNAQPAQLPQSAGSQPKTAEAAAVALTNAEADRLSAMRLNADAPVNTNVTSNAVGQNSTLNTPQLANADVNSSLQLVSKAKSGAKTPTASNTRATTTGTSDTQAGSTSAVNTKALESAEHMRSTLEFAARGNATDDSPELPSVERSDVLDINAVASLPGSESPTGDGLAQAHAGGDTGAAAGPAGTEASASAEAFTEVFQSQMDEVGSQISYWSAQGAQRASFTVGSDQDNPVEVTLAFSEGSLEVNFETEEAGVRELLENNAHDALQHLMEAQGIVLGAVSVGGGRSNAQRDKEAGNATVDLAQRGRTAKVGASTDAALPSARRTPEIMTATKLDFYA